MQIGFFTAFVNDPQHYLHAVALIASARRHMPAVPITQFTDDRSPIVPGVDSVRRLPCGPLLDLRLEHYAACEGDWLLIDTDVEIRADVWEIFPPTPFDIALPDRNWPGIPQGDLVMHSMPFNTGVVFTRNRRFWQEVYQTWCEAENKDWLSEQRAVYEVVRTGRFLVQILPGQIYNYPPRSADDPCTGAKLVHYKGARKAWWTDRYYESLRTAKVPACCASV